MVGCLRLRIGLCLIMVSWLCLFVLLGGFVLFLFSMFWLFVCLVLVVLMFGCCVWYVDLWVHS